MPGLAHNPQLLLSAFLRLARDQDDPAAWVKAIQFAALTSNPAIVENTLNGLQDQYASNVTSEAGSTAWLRSLDLILIAQLCEAALQTLEAEEAADEDDLTAAPPGSVRYADFSKWPCTLG